MCLNTVITFLTAKMCKNTKAHFRNVYKDNAIMSKINCPRAFDEQYSTKDYITSKKHSYIIINLLIGEQKWNLQDQEVQEISYLMK